MRCTRLYGDMALTRWWPFKSEAKPSKSPIYYLSDMQRVELLYRYAPLTAVVQKKGKDFARFLKSSSAHLIGLLPVCHVGKKITRILIINSALVDNDDGTIVHG